MKKIILLMLAILLVSKISYATSSKDNKVFLVWERIPNAVMYELIIKKKYYKLLRKIFQNLLSKVY